MEFRGTTFRRAGIPVLTALAAVGMAFGLSLPGSRGEPAACADLKDADASYTICSYTAKRADIRMFLTDDDGENWGSFTRLAKALSSRGETLTFAMNAGMYHKDYSPVGLYVEDGVQRQKANVRRGPGNFHLMPNGVFYVSDRGAGVADTKQFLRLRGKMLHATQSGPMLVINGKIHPKFRAESESFKIRNGVGSCANGKVVFAISNTPVTFHAFAKLFKDSLKCRNALFLDGSISSMYAPSIKRSDGWRPMGPIVGVVEKKQTASK
ncbi:MAG: phosphodiester glycosidase family protein [Beijerinckiaceae bacterium]